MPTPVGGRGTQAYVHLGCLARWQRTSSSPSRRLICPVCKAAYSSQYVPRQAVWGTDSTAGRWLPPFVRNMALMIALMAGTLVSAGPVVLATLLAVVIVLCFDHLQELLGFKLCLLVGNEGTPILRLVRVGSPIPGLGVGALLVATDAIGAGIFHRTVIVITRFDEAGTLGYIVNCPITHLPATHTGFESGPPLQHALAVPELPDAIQHCLGGPVDLQSWVVFHRFATVPGATPLGGGIVLGGDLAEIAGHARQAARVRAREQSNSTSTPTEPVLAKALHGHAAWAVGQLEGEIRSQMWEWAPDIGPEFTMHRTDAEAELQTWYRAVAAVAVRNADARGHPAAHDPGGLHVH